MTTKTDQGTYPAYSAAPRPDLVRVDGKIRIMGGCDFCNGYREFRQMPNVPYAYHLTLQHDDTCPEVI